MRDENMIAALKRERAAYAARGMDDRVAEVDEQLTHYGHDPAGEEAPQGRTGPEQTKQTADETKQAGEDPNVPKDRTGPEGAKETTGGQQDGATAKRGTGRSRKPQG